MLETIVDESSNLSHLYDVTLGLLRDDDRITRTLDWVDQVLPVFVGACRREVRTGSCVAIERWENWLESDAALVIEEAGKGEVYAWRVDWLRIMLDVTRRLQAGRQWDDAEYRKVFAEGLRDEYSALPACFSLTYWYDLTDYLCSAPPARESVRQAIVFPLVLSEPIVDGGTETNVVMAQFVLESVAPQTGEAFLHPFQTVVRCMDDRFADGFSDAARAAQVDLPATIASTGLPGVRVRIQTIKPGHERFITGIILRGESGAGALALGLRQIYLGITKQNNDLAVSFALHRSGSSAIDGSCYQVGGTEDKVRGCAKHGIRRLLVAKQQQTTLALYGRKHSIQIMGSGTVAEASTLTANEASVPVAAPPKKIVVLYHRRGEQDRYVLKLIEDRMSARGHQVFIDRNKEIGIVWAQETDQRIRESDVVVPLLSPTSVVSDMLASELQTADEARQAEGSRPLIIPVRVGYTDSVPDRIGFMIDALPQISWNDSADDESLISEIEHRMLKNPEPSELTPRPAPATHAAIVAPGGPARSDLEPFDGLVPLNSRFYIERGLDRPFYSAITQRHSIILVKGARQMGKSSLLARGLKHAEQQEARTVLTDFQKMSASDLQSIRTFYLALARMLARQLGVEVALDDVWVDRRSPNLNFEEYMEDYLIPTAGSLVWAMDEVDKLFFSSDFSSDVFGLFRSWANERQGRSSSPWANVAMVIAYATEAHLFISDVNQSPFNVGTRFEMEDFTVDQVAELNRRYGEPLKNESELRRFYNLVGGHPYLVRRGLYAIVIEKTDVNAFQAEAARDNGPLGDHLRRILTLLARNADNVAAIREILRGKPCPSFEAFYHLRSAGIVVGESAQNASIRCQLYKVYLERYLL